jgi:sialic acid synthase SpsE
MLIPRTFGSIFSPVNKAKTYYLFYKLLKLNLIKSRACVKESKVVGIMYSISFFSVQIFVTYFLLKHLFIYYNNF